MRRPWRGSGASDAVEFVVDPIDGTRAFISGSADWSISVALAERARLILAARDRFAAQAAAMVDLVVRENGKPPVEAWFAEIIPK